MDFQFKLKNNLIGVETRLRRMNYSDGYCKVCSLNEPKLQENMEHMLMTCQYKKKIWVLIEKLVKKSFGDLYSIQNFEILCGLFSEDLKNDDLFIINMILGMTRYHLYLMRNHTKYEAKQVGFIECYIKLRCYLSGHIRMLLLSKKLKQYNKDKLNEVLIHISTIFRNGINEQDL